MNKPVDPEAASSQPTGVSLDDIDAHVGSRVRFRRIALGISQTSLAEHLGLTFQQVQKYESGANRMSASKLYMTACYLSSPITYFFDGLSNPMSQQETDANHRAERVLSTFESKIEGCELAVDFPRIGSRRVRQQVVRLVHALAEESAVGSSLTSQGEA